RRSEHVVDSPPYVALPRTAPLAPPRVVTVLTGMARAKRIDPTRFDPAGELRAFFRQKAARLRIVFRPREVDFLVRRVEVADHEHAAAPPPPLHVREDRAVEIELVRDAAVVPIPAAALREI